MRRAVFIVSVMAFATSGGAFARLSNAQTPSLLPTPNATLSEESKPFNADDLADREVAIWGQLRGELYGDQRAELDVLIATPPPPGSPEAVNDPDIGKFHGFPAENLSPAKRALWMNLLQSLDSSQRDLLNQLILPTKAL